MENPKLLLDAKAFDRAVRDMAERLAGQTRDPEELALIGIRTHGVTLARRLHKLLAIGYEWDVPLGILDITLYRDDFDQLAQQPIVRPTRIDFDVTGRTVVVVDDVLYTGRTIRCALDQIIDYGRPKAIRLAVLVDRGLRELPIQPDIVGARTQTTRQQKVEVCFSETDEADGVWIHDVEDPGT